MNNSTHTVKAYFTAWEGESLPHAVKFRKCRGQNCRGGESEQTKILSYDLPKSRNFAKILPVQLPWIFSGVPLKVNGASGNIQGNLTAMQDLAVRFLNIHSQRTRDATITSLLRQNDAMTSFWRNNDVFIASCVRYVST